MLYALLVQDMPGMLSDNEALSDGDDKQPSRIGHRSPSPALQPERTLRRLDYQLLQERKGEEGERF